MLLTNHIARLVKSQEIIIYHMKFILCMFLDIVRIKNKKNDNDDDQIMNAQMTLHIHIEGFQILIWQSELVLETFCNILKVSVQITVHKIYCKYMFLKISQSFLKRKEGRKWQDNIRTSFWSEWEKFVGNIKKWLWHLCEHCCPIVEVVCNLFY